MSQHFLLSAKARTLSLASVARMAEDEARATFRAIRWAATDGEPVCPTCGCVACYEYASRPIFKCKGCGHQFSVTSGTIFASRKLPVRDYLLAIAIFVNGAKGHSRAPAQPRSRRVSTRRPSCWPTSCARRWRPSTRARCSPAMSRSTAPTSAATSGPRTARPIAWTAAWPSTRRGKRRCVVVMRERGGPHPAVRGDHRGSGRAVRPAGRSRPAARSTPTRRRHGTRCTPTTTPGGSTTASRSMTRAWTPIRPSRSSRGCAAPRSASTTTSASTCTSMPARWLGARTTGASRTARSS